MVPFTAWPCLKAVTVCLSDPLMSVWSVHTSKLIWLWLHHLLYRVYESSLKETWSKVNRSLLVYMWILWASSVSAQTFEPFVCRADHGISLFPVKLNHPARGKKRTVWFTVGNVTGSKSVFNKSNWSDRKWHTCLCAGGNPPVPSCATTETPWAERKQGTLIIYWHHSKSFDCKMTLQQIIKLHITSLMSWRGTLSSFSHGVFMCVFWPELFAF